jgi:glucose/arabinose dehydrogenase
MRNAVLLAVFTGALVCAQVQQFDAKLPPPGATPSSVNGPKVVDRPEAAHLQVPQGFAIEEYATGFEEPRYMTFGPGGEILLSDSKKGIVYVLTDKAKAYKDPEHKELIKGLDRP